MSGMNLLLKGRFTIYGNDRVGKKPNGFENFSCRGDELCVFFLNKETGLEKKST